MPRDTVTAVKARASLVREQTSACSVCGGEGLLPEDGSALGSEWKAGDRCGRCRGTGRVTHSWTVLDTPQHRVPG
jgi:DnaJ-class molecular chaperone